MSHPAKIVRIIARLNVGGPAKHVVWLTDGLDKSRYQTLLVAGTVPDGEGDMGYFAEQAGVEPLFIPQMSREISLNDAATVWKLFRLLQRERPDIVHTHTAKAGTVGRVAGFLYRWLTLGALVGRPRKCKFVHTYHGHIFHSYYGAFKTRLFLSIEKILARLVTDKIVVVSDQQRLEICQKFGVGKPKQIRVIPLGLDLEIFGQSSEKRSQFRDELRVDEDTVLVGIVGRLTEIKNHRLFLTAVSDYKKSESAAALKAHFVIIGDGSLRQPLQEQCGSLGLEKEVTFAAERNDPDYFYPALDVVALTSLNEGTPLTLIEAMANKRAVIATKVGGVVDLLGATVEGGPFEICERGITIAPGDGKSFALGLERLVRDSDLRRELGERAFEFVQNKYPKQRLLLDIENLYEELLSTKPALVESSSSGARVQRV